MTPFLAAHLHGYDNFKWMLYGDDDTVFFIDNALDMLEGLDHNMPYFLTDHLWFPDQFGKRLTSSIRPCGKFTALNASKGSGQSKHFFLLPLTACAFVTRLARVWHNVLGLLANLWLALACA